MACGRYLASIVLHIPADAAVGLGAHTRLGAGRRLRHIAFESMSGGRNNFCLRRTADTAGGGLHAICGAGRRCRHLAAVPLVISSLGNGLRLRCSAPAAGVSPDTLRGTGGSLRHLAAVPRMAECRDHTAVILHFSTHIAIGLGAASFCCTGGSHCNIAAPVMPRSSYRLSFGSTADSTLICLDTGRLTSGLGRNGSGIPCMIACLGNGLRLRRRAQSTLIRLHSVFRTCGSLRHCTAVPRMIAALRKCRLRSDPRSAHAALHAI